jgi:hypothetical protein
MWGVYAALWQEVTALLEIEVETHANVLGEASDLEGQVEPAWMMKVGNYQCISVLEACSAEH